MSSDNLYVAANHQHVLCRTMRWDDVFGGNLIFSRDTGLVTPEQGIGHKDTVMVLQVVSSGPGNVSRGVLNESKVQGGDIVLANRYHQTHDVRIDGSYHQTYNWEQIMAKLTVDDDSKEISIEPLQAYIICKRNEPRAQRILQGSEGLIVAPGIDSHYTGNVEKDDKGRPREQIKVAVEEVVSCGPGAVVDGLWQVPPQIPGNMIMYDTSVSPVQVRIGGQAYTIVHYRHVMLTFWGDESPINVNAPGVNDNEGSNASPQVS